MSYESIQPQAGIILPVQAPTIQKCLFCDEVMEQVKPKQPVPFSGDCDLHLDNEYKFDKF